MTGAIQHVYKSTVICHWLFEAKPYQMYEIYWMFYVGNAKNYTNCFQSTFFKFKATQR
jgi:hypothetical protein